MNLAEEQCCENEHDSLKWSSVGDVQVSSKKQLPRYKLLFHRSTLSALPDCRRIITGTFFYPPNGGFCKPASSHVIRLALFPRPSTILIYIVDNMFDLDQKLATETFEHLRLCPTLYDRAHGLTFVSSQWILIKSCPTTTLAEGFCLVLLNVYR
jgi:hypothetical protein